VVLPKLRNTEYFSQLNASGYPPDQLPFGVPLMGDLLLLFVYGNGEKFSLVTPSDMTTLGLDVMGLKQLATNGCADFLRQMTVHTHGAVHRVSSPNSTAAACIALFPGVWRELERDLGGPFVFAIAGEDEAFFVQNQPDALAELKHALVQDGHERAEDMLSAFLYEFDSDGQWRTSNVQIDSIQG
jgi:hypothetical protein